MSENCPENVLKISAWYKVVQKSSDIMRLEPPLIEDVDEHD